MSGWSILFWLIITFLLLHPLSRWINTHIQGVAFLLTGSSAVAVWFFWVLFLPGTTLHELSHWITAKLLGVKTKQFSLWPKQKKGGELQMGAVQIEVSDPFRHSIIGVAPLIFGSLAVVLIGQGWLGMDRLGEAILSGNLERITETLGGILSVSDVWLWLYLTFAIANAMLPSASDRESWRTVFIYLGLTLLVAVGLGLSPTLSPQIQQFGLLFFTFLLSAFVITIMIDLFFILLIVIAETILGVLLGRRIQYKS